MNYLAHFYFSHPDEGLMVGNFIADKVKGKQYLNYSEEIKAGILHHRFLDTETDSSEWIRNCTEILRSSQGKYAPVVVDVLFDYYLSNHWNDYSTIPLDRFIASVHTTLGKHQDVFPEFMQFVFQRMKELQWLSMYRSIDGISTILYQMGQRVNYENNMKNAHLVLIDNHKDFEENFDQFIKEMKSKNEHYLESI